MLLEHEDEYTIVESEMVSMLQHNAFLWGIKGPAFVRRQHFSESSKLIDQTMHAWLDNLSNEEKEKFINITFDALEKSGFKDFNDLGPTDIPKVFSLMGNMLTIDAESRKKPVPGDCRSFAGQWEYGGIQYQGYEYCGLCKPGVFQRDRGSSQSGR